MNNYASKKAYGTQSVGELPSLTGGRRTPNLMMKGDRHTQSAQMLVEKKDMKSPLTSRILRNNRNEGYKVHNHKGGHRRSSCEGCLSGYREHNWPEQKIFRLSNIKPINP